MKTCSKCKESLATDMFTRDTSKKDNLYSSCKRCQRSWGLRTGRINHKERLSDEYKRCKKCKKRDKQKVDGYYSSCKDCRHILYKISPLIKKQLNNKKYKRENNNKLHRNIIKKMLKRKLKKSKIVHHKNEIKTDNKLKNLEIISNSNHVRLHSLEYYSNIPKTTVKINYQYYKKKRYNKKSLINFKNYRCRKCSIKYHTKRDK
jgi:hypothetical protein